MSSARLAATSLAVLLSATGAAVKAQDPAHRPGAPAAQTKLASAPEYSVPQLEQALAKTPDDPKVNVALGVAYLQRGDHPRALERFRHAVKVAPDFADAHNWLGFARIRLTPVGRASVSTTPEPSEGPLFRTVTVYSRL